MPKKKASPQFPKPTSPVHPSLWSSPSASKGHHIPRSFHSTTGDTGNLVNDLIQRQRLSFVSPSAKVNQPSLARGPIQAQTLPPSLDAILQGADIVLPGLTSNMSRFSARSGPAGPPPPGSWHGLEQGNHLSRKKVNASSAKDGTIGGGNLQRSRPYETLPGLGLPDERSLQWQVLKSIALRWDWHMEHQLGRIASFPLQTRQLLPYFIAKYNRGAMKRVGLEALFGDVGGLNDLNPLTHLELGTLIKSDCSLDDLIDILVKEPLQASASNQDRDDLVIPDAWDAPETDVNIPLHLPSFHTLTHLSLAHPTIASPWRSLLRVAPHLTTLTHLSLAYWPTPYFRSFDTVFGKSELFYAPGRFGEEIAGNGLRETPRILRKLSRATYCLKWLDLTGCCGWFWALQCNDGPDWAGSWRGVQIVKAGLVLMPEPELAIIKPAVNCYVDYVKLNRQFVDFYDRAKWLAISEWVWYVQSVQRMERLVNRLRMGPPTAKAQLQGASEEDTRTEEEKMIDNLMTHQEREAKILPWWASRFNGPLGKGLQLRIDREPPSGDSHVVMFEASPNESLILAELIKALDSRGEVIDSVIFAGPEVEP